MFVGRYTGSVDKDYQKVVAWSRGQEKISVAAILREFGILPSEGEPILERMKRDGLLEPGITKKTWIVKKQGGQADSSGDKTVTLDDCMCNARDEYEAHHDEAARQWLSRAEGLAQKVDVALLRRMGACAFRHKDFGLARQFFERGLNIGGEPAYLCCLGSAAASIAQGDWAAAEQSVGCGLKSLEENGEPPGGPYECKLKLLRETVQMLGHIGSYSGVGVAWNRSVQIRYSSGGLSGRLIRQGGFVSRRSGLRQREKTSLSMSCPIPKKCV